MNILILSVGTRNKIVQYFKQSGADKVVVTDMQAVAPALYEADTFYLVPRITAPGYIDRILEICQQEHIDAVLSLIDPELSLLAENEQRFADIGVTVVGSSYALCEMSLNKMDMFRFCRDHNLSCLPSYDDLTEFYRDLDAGKVSFPVMMKPICGSASIAITRVNDRASLDFLGQHAEGFMVQPFLQKQEIGADVYIDMLTGEVVSIFTKKKLLMRSGETDKAVSFKDPKLFDLIERFVTEAGYRGQIDIDLFLSDGEYYISEVNPRFGGGYPHAYACGCDHMKLILNNLRGIPNEKHIGDYEEGLCMMKYNEIMVQRIEGV